MRREGEARLARRALQAQEIEEPQPLSDSNAAAVRARQRELATATRILATSARVRAVAREQHLPMHQAVAVVLAESRREE